MTGLAGLLGMTPAQLSDDLHGLAGAAIVVPIAVGLICLLVRYRAGVAKAGGVVAIVAAVMVCISVLYVSKGR